MARVARLSKRKFKTDSVQGPLSYVIFSKPQFAESRNFVSDLRTATKGLVDSERAIETEEEMISLILEQIIDKFIEWNWQDDKGEPLVTPNDTNFDLDDLMAEEVDVLIDCIRSLFGIGEERQGKSIV